MKRQEDKIKGEEDDRFQRDENSNSQGIATPSSPPPRQETLQHTHL